MPDGDDEPPCADLELARAVQRGDQAAFRDLFARLQAAVLRVARLYVRSGALAEEVAQETWIGVIRGVHRFEGRSSLKSWVLRIAANCAKERAVVEGRALRLSLSAVDDEPLIEPERLRTWPDPWVGGWKAEAAPRDWDDAAEAKLFGRELRLLVLDAISALPDAQRMVITLRDVDGLPAEDVAAILGISEANQRVLLHRARVKVRKLVARHFGEE